MRSGYDYDTLADGSHASSSPSSRRRSPERSGGSICAAARSGRQWGRHVTEYRDEHFPELKG